MNSSGGPSHGTLGLDENILPVELQTKNVVTPTTFIIAPPPTSNGAIVKKKEAAPKGQDQPYVVIAEQPQQRGFRFRYECEGPSHGGLQGTRSERSRKSYPTIKIENYSGAARVVVSLVTDEKCPRSHAHKLLGNNCKNGLCTMEVQADLDEITFPNLSILHVTKKKLVDVLTDRILDTIKLNKKIKENNMNIDPVITVGDRQTARRQAEEQSKSMQLNVVRLCFQVFLRNSDGSLSKMLTPVVSQPIYDSKSPGASALKICRMDKYGGCCSGSEEVFLLCEKVQKDDVLVRFVEQNPDGSVKWEAYGNFGPLDVHRQYAIVFKTPAYYNTNIDKAVNVLIMLQRKSDQEVSEPKAFTYFPLNRDKDNIASKKRKRIPLDSYDFGDGGLGGDPGTGSDGQDGTGGGGSGGGGNNSSQPMVVYQPNVNTLSTGQGTIPQSVSDAIQAENQLAEEALSRQSTVEALRQAATCPLPDTRDRLSVDGTGEDSDVEVDAAPMSPEPLHSRVAFNLKADDLGEEEDSLKDVSEYEDTADPGDRIHPDKTNTDDRTDLVDRQYSDCTKSGSMTDTDDRSHPNTMDSDDRPHLDETDKSDMPLPNRTDTVDRLHPVTTDSDDRPHSDRIEPGGMPNPDKKVGSETSLDWVDSGMGTDTSKSILGLEDKKSIISLVVGEEDEGETVEEGHRGQEEENGKSKRQGQKDRRPSEGVQSESSDNKADVVSMGMKSDEGFSESSEDAATKMHTLSNKLKTSTLACPPCDSGVSSRCSQLTDTMRQVTSRVAERTLAALADYAETGDIRHLLMAQRHLLAVSNENGDLPLHLAIINGQPEVLKNLLDVFWTLPSPERYINSLNLLRQTPLHLSAIVQSEAMVERLLHCGADPTIADRHGNTAAHLAVLYHAHGCLKSLVKYLRPGADRFDPFPELNYLNFDGYSPVHLAVLEGSVEMLTTLVFGRADVSLPDGKSGKTALHHAVETDDLPVAGYLLMEAQSHVNARTFDGNTALHIACARQLVGMVALLVMAGADVRCENEEIPDTDYELDCPGLRPIDYANSNHQILQILLGEDWDSKSPTSDSITQDSFIEFDMPEKSVVTARHLRELSRLLDPSEPGKDVIALADHLGYARLTTALQGVKLEGLSATSFLLEYVQTQEGNLDRLKAGLQAIERSDILGSLFVLDRGQDILPGHGQLSL